MQPVIVKRVDEELKHMAGEIAWYEEESRKAVGLLLQYRLEIGKRLVRAKSLLPHGKFLQWARREFGWTPRHVQNHLRLAANAGHVSHLPPGTSLNMALAAIKKANPNGRKGEVRGNVLAFVQRVHLIGEIEEGTLDCQALIEEMVRVAARFGASKTKWRTRYGFAQGLS